MEGQTKINEKIYTEKERAADIMFSKMLAKKETAHVIAFVKENDPMGTLNKWIIPVSYKYNGGEKIVDENFDSVTCDIYNAIMTPIYFTKEEVKEKMLKNERNRELYEKDRVKFNKKLKKIMTKLNRKRLAEVVCLDVESQSNYGIRPERKTITRRKVK